ncbi:response regulator [Brevibacterium sp. 5221]|uniref:Transcriptional regulatory protein n=1 Tax=Brevibacterium rongguiense TaxID=2695267 RepID=A0A6N9H8R8_9MICO|nr:response regulator [Brevibacterium rongguiense]MYM20146.1 response regulator [Brevibacterium rongguiense]
MTDSSEPGPGSGAARGCADVGVLVVEDEAIAAQAHAEYVRRVDGFSVLGIAKNASQALAAMTGQIAGLEARRIDLLLLDMNLGDGHGVTLMRALRARRIRVDVIAVTASRDMKVVQDALSLGVVQYVIKPFTFPVFKSKLEAYLEFRQRFEPSPAGEDMTQTEVDAVLAALAAAPPKQAPKGVPEAMHCQLVAAIETGGALSAAEAGETVGVSRVTARRYLESMADAGVLSRQPRYGAAGRPVLEYSLAERGPGRGPGAAPA